MIDKVPITFHVMNTLTKTKTETIVVGSTICGLGADKFVGLKEGMDLGVIYFARNICPLLYILFHFFPTGSGASSSRKMSNGVIDGFYFTLILNSL